MNIQNYASKLQSRIATRARVITEQENWKVFHRALDQMNDWRKTKALLKELSNDQILDKQLLKLVQDVPVLVTENALLRDWIADIGDKEGF